MALKGIPSDELIGMYAQAVLRDDDAVAITLEDEMLDRMESDREEPRARGVGLPVGREPTLESF